MPKMFSAVAPGLPPGFAARGAVDPWLRSATTDEEREALRAAAKQIGDDSVALNYPGEEQWASKLANIGNTISEKLKGIPLKIQEMGDAMKNAPPKMDVPPAGMEYHPGNPDAMLKRSPKPPDAVSVNSIVANQQEDMSSIPAAPAPWLAGRIGNFNPDIVHRGGQLSMPVGVREGDETEYKPFTQLKPSGPTRPMPKFDSSDDELSVHPLVAFQSNPSSVNFNRLQAMANAGSPERQKRTMILLGDMSEMMRDKMRNETQERLAGVRFDPSMNEERTRAGITKMILENTPFKLGTPEFDNAFNAAMRNVRPDNIVNRNSTPTTVREDAGPAEKEMSKQLVDERNLRKDSMVNEVMDLIPEGASASDVARIVSDYETKYKVTMPDGIKRAMIHNISLKRGVNPADVFKEYERGKLPWIARLFGGGGNYQPGMTGGY